MGVSTFPANTGGGGGGGGSTGKVLAGTGTFTLNLVDGAYRITSANQFILNSATLKVAGEQTILESITSIQSAYSTAAPSTASQVTTATAGDGGNRAFATNGTTVISTDDGQLYYSTNDGASWVTATLPNRQYADFCAYGNGKFIAIGTKSGNQIVIWYSTNGITWVQATLSDVNRTGSLFGIVPHPGGFIAPAGNIVFASSDGINWTTHSSPQIGSPVYEPTSKMFFGYNYQNLSYPLYSTDGKIWQQSGFSTGNTIRSVAVIPGRVYFFMYGNSRYFQTAAFNSSTPLTAGPSIGQSGEQNSLFDGVDTSFIFSDSPNRINRLNPDGSVTLFDQNGYIPSMAWSPVGGKFWMSLSNTTRYSQSPQIAVSALVETLSTEVISPD